MAEADLARAGGIAAATAPDYLALPNVLCVGGSWLATREEIAEGDWAGVTDKSQRAAAFAA